MLHLGQGPLVQGLLGPRLNLGQGPGPVLALPIPQVDLCVAGKSGKQLVNAVQYCLKSMPADLRAIYEGKVKFSRGMPAEEPMG